MNILLTVVGISIVVATSYGIWFAIWSYNFTLKGSGWLGM